MKKLLVFLFAFVFVFSMYSEPVEMYKPSTNTPENLNKRIEMDLEEVNGIAAVLMRLRDVHKAFSAEQIKLIGIKIRIVEHGLNLAYWKTDLCDTEGVGAFCEEAGDHLREAEQFIRQLRAYATEREM